jgi:hypothetical protein
MFTRIAGELLFGGAAYLAWARLPAAYPAAVKLTGAALVTRSVVDRLATICLATGAIGGFGLTLVKWPLHGRRKSSRD